MKKQCPVCGQFVFDTPGHVAQEHANGRNAAAAVANGRDRERARRQDRLAQNRRVIR